MSKTTITLTRGQHAAIREALLDRLLGETDRLQSALIGRDRHRHLKRARNAERRVHRLARILDRVDRREKTGQRTLRLDLKVDLPLLVGALRDLQGSAYDGARDAHAHENGEQATCTTAWLQEVCQTCLHVEAHALRTGRRLPDEHGAGA